MKAWLIDQMSGLSALRIAEIPDPVAGNGEVVLELDYAALNPADRYLAEGMYPAKPRMPHILGRDGVGRVIALRPGADQFKIGQRVLILRGEAGVNQPGTFAQRVVVAVDSLAAIPQNWSTEESAGASLVYLTAYQALTQWGDLPPGIVLVTGASGGVGVASIQLGSAMGHTMVALSRGSEKRSRLLALGAKYVIDPTESNWARSLKETMGKNRVDLVIDMIGGGLFSQMLETLGYQAKVSVVGRLAGPVPEFNTASLFFRRLRIGGVAVGTYTPAESQAAWGKIQEILKKAAAKPIVDRVFQFEELPAAFERLAAGPIGKVLLRIAPA